MRIINTKLFKENFDRYVSYFITPNLVRNVIIFGGGIILFIIGVIAYGIIINLRDIPLEKAMRQKGISKLNNPLIIIDRRNYSLLLFNDTVFIKSFRANFGRNVNNPKMLAGDLATPVGNYKICKIDTGTKYYKFFELDYPNVSDAEEALRRGIISQVQYDSLILDYHNNLCPRADTPLGGHIGIQGIGELNYIFRYLPFNYNWTDGSIAISNEAMDELYSVVKKGTKVVIK